MAVPVPHDDLERVEPGRQPPLLRVGPPAPHPQSPNIRPRGRGGGSAGRRGRGARRECGRGDSSTFASPAGRLRHRTRRGTGGSRNQPWHSTTRSSANPAFWSGRDGSTCRRRRRGRLASEEGETAVGRRPPVEAEGGGRNRPAPGRPRTSAGSPPPRTSGRARGTGRTRARSLPSPEVGEAGSSSGARRTTECFWPSRSPGSSPRERRLLLPQPRDCLNRSAGRPPVGPTGPCSKSPTSQPVPSAQSSARHTEVSHGQSPDRRLPFRPWPGPRSRRNPKPRPPRPLLSRWS